MPYTRTDSPFINEGLECAAWLYMPEGEPKPPIVVMAHGMGAERNMRLPAFAEEFAEKGLAVFVFDYRNFGDSQGKPRNLIDHDRHLSDWQAALQHVRNLKNIDAKRIGLWGTSFSGGHVLYTSADDHDIKAVVSQVPFVDGTVGGDGITAAHILKVTAHALLDKAKETLGLGAHQVPLISGPEGFGLLVDPVGPDAFQSLLPDDSTWENRVPVRFALKLPKYRPIKHVHKIQAPVLVIAAEDDSLIPVKHVERTAKRIKNAEFVNLSCGHFAPYTGDMFKTVSKLESEFFVKHLLKH